MGRKLYVDGRYGQVHVEMVGSGPPILLHHQAPADREQFRRGSIALSDLGYTAVMVDTPGFGGSDRPSAPPTIEELAETTRAVVEGIGLGPVALLGHHTGAMIATEAAVQFPELVRAVILQVPMPLTPEEASEWHNQVVTFEKNWTYRKDGSHLQQVWDNITSYAPGWSDLDSMHWIIASTLKAGNLYWYGHNACFQYDHEAGLRKLSALKKPVLILANDGDICFPLAQRARALFPEFSYAEFPGGTFDFANEQPAVWARAIAEFVK